MESEQYLLSKIDEIFNQIEDIKIRYEHKRYNDVHLVESLPLSILNNIDYLKLEKKYVLENALNLSLKNLNIKNNINKKMNNTYKGPLYKEMINGKHITAKQQEGFVYCSTLEKATEEEIQQARDEFARTNICTHHFTHDEECWIYDERICGICGRSVAMI